MSDPGDRINELIEKLSRAKALLDAPVEMDADASPEDLERMEESRENRARYYRELAEELLDGLSPEMRDMESDTAAAAGSGGLAVVVGHSKDRHGTFAMSPPFPPGLGREEYHWNSDLALKIKEIADQNGIRCKIFTRNGFTIPEAYVPVKAWKPSATIELHFNSAHPNARGTETWYGHETSVPWAAKLQARMVSLYERRGTTDRKTKDARKIDSDTGDRFRAFTSTTQIQPSALIEPFFDQHLEECQLAVVRKAGLARAIVEAYGELVGTPLASTSGTTGSGSPKPVLIDPKPGTAPVVTGETGANPSGPAPGLPESPLFAELRSLYLRPETTIEFPELKVVTLAQWALESGWGTSDLAKLHLNFAGMKGKFEIEKLKDIATVVTYNAHDGPDRYLRFGTLANFITGYWRFLERSPYSGWKATYRLETDPAKKERRFIQLIGSTWAPVDAFYVQKIMDLVQAIRAALAAAPVATEPPSVGGAGAPIIPDGASSGQTLSPAAIPADAQHFRALFDEAVSTQFEHAPLAATVLAQCAIESNWGRSQLAMAHFNFAGIEWGDDLKSFAVPVDYQTSGGAVGKYGRFIDYAAFLKGYFARLDTDPRFSGWRQHATNPQAFLNLVGPKWRPADPNYAANIAGVRTRLTAGAAAPGSSGTGSGTNPGTGTPPALAPGQIPDGYVIYVKRRRMDRKGGQTRTVGSYSVFFRGQKVPGLEGDTCEPHGPGDNGRSGTANARRVEAKTYPLGTHLSPSGGNYSTHTYTSSMTAYARLRPAIRLDETGHRGGILFHPAGDFLDSVGCINLSKPLASASNDIDWSDSRKRVIAIIDDMKQRLGASFPATSWKTIPNAWMIFEDAFPQSDDMESDPLADVTDAHVSPAARAGTLRTLLQGAGGAAAMEPSRIFEIAAAAINGTVPEIVNVGLLRALLGAGIKLKDLRDESGGSLWSAWADGAEAASKASAQIGDAARTALAEVATILKAEGVAIDGTEGLHTPLVRAAIADNAAAIAALLGVGADPDARDRFGLTPLIAAAFFGAPAAVAALLGRANRTIGMGKVQAGAAGAENEARYAELPEEGETPLGAAEYGRSLFVYEPARNAEFRDVIDLLTRT